MFTQKTAYPVVMIVSLAIATAIAFAALVHAYTHMHFFW